MWKNYICLDLKLENIRLHLTFNKLFHETL